MPDATTAPTRAPRCLVRSLLIAAVALGGSAQGAGNDRGASDARLSAEDLKAYTTYVEGAMERWHVPGAGIAVVQDGEIVLAEGFGVTETDAGRAVTADTRFVLGSASKSISDTLVAALVDDLPLGWDTPAVEIHPDFQLGEDGSGEQVTIRDLLSMRAGIENGDALWEDKRLDPWQLMQALTAVDPAGAPGERFVYDNIGMAAGVYLGVLSAVPQADDLFGAYAALLQTRVLDPIGMTRTTVDPFAALANREESWPHAFDADRAEHVPMTTFLEGNGPGDGILPAGGIASTARDMGRFLAMQLEGGMTADGSRVASAERLGEMRTRHSAPDDAFETRVFLPGSFAIETDAEVGYGIGWFVGRYQGVPTLVDPGDQQGFSSVLAMLPDSNTAIAVLTNAELLPCGYGFLMSVQNRLTEIVHGLERRIEPLVEDVNSQAGIACRSTPDRAAGDVVETPAITDDAGLTVPGSVATVESLMLGGVEQSVVIRGHDRTKPVLLMLHGGPGFAMSPWLELFQTPLLEEHFVVVHWDQRGAGKSFSTALSADDMSIDRLVDDTLELTDVLRERFGQDKLFLTGHSWGSALGFLTLMKRPEPFHAFIASSEAAHWERRQRLSYEWVLGQARDAGDTRIQAELESLEPFDPTRPSHVDVKDGYLDRYRGGDVYTEGLWDIYLDHVMTGKSPLYSSDDTDRFLQGMELSRETLDAEIAQSGYDLFERYPTSSIPVHFLAGRHDQSTPGLLAERYFHALDAPDKSFTWFERSGHSLMFDEPEKWARTLVDIKEKTLGH